MTNINDFTVVGLVREGGRSYLRFEIDTSFDPDVSQFGINVSSGENSQHHFSGNVYKSYANIWGGSGFGVIEPISGSRYSINFELPDRFRFPEETIQLIEVFCKTATDRRWLWWR